MSDKMDKLKDNAIVNEDQENISGGNKQVPPPIPGPIPPPIVPGGPTPQDKPVPPPIPGPIPPPIVPNK